MMNIFLINLFLGFLVILILLVGSCCIAVLLYTMCKAYVYKDFNKAMCESSDKMMDIFEKIFG